MRWASSADSSAQVGGVGTPAACSSRLVIDLSTLRSIARASLVTGTPNSRSACSTPEALGHLLEAAAGDAAHEHGVGQRGAEARQHEAVPGVAGVDAAVGEIEAAADRACARAARACSCRVCQPVSSVMIATRAPRSRCTATDPPRGCGPAWQGREGAPARPMPGARPVATLKLRVMRSSGCAAAPCSAGRHARSGPSRGG